MRDPGWEWQGDAGARGPDGGAVGIRLLAPPDGEEAPINLALVVVAAEDPGLAEGLAGVTITGPDGVAVEAEPRWPGPGEPFCAGWPDGRCIVVDVAEPLAGGAAYTVAIAGASLWFRTGGAYDLDPPAGDVEVSSSDGCLVARAAVAEPAWATLVATDHHVSVTGGIGRDHELALVWTAAPALVTPALILVDLAGNSSRIDAHELAAAPATIVITEVLANPAGAEPRQEWVEIANLTGAPVDLLGLAIADEGGNDTLPAVTVPAGARALIVPAGYDPAAPGDVAPPDGTILARLDGNTIGGGLANAGETVSLLGTAGERLSVFTSYFDTSTSSWQGRSVERIRPGGCDVGANVAANANGSSTPGLRNSVE